MSCLLFSGCVSRSNRDGTKLGRLALRRLGGLPEDWPYRKTKLPLRSKIASQIGRIEYVRLQIQEGKAEPIASGGASILSSTTRAEGFLLTEESSEGFAEGEDVELWLYD